MGDVAWKKYIIKVECERSSDLFNRRDPTGSCSTIYFCRTCPSFHTPVKENVIVHLSQLHPVDPAIHDGLCASPQSDERAQLDHPKVDSSLEQSSSTARSISASPNMADSGSPIAPGSPVSPILKEMLSSSRKRITITSGVSPRISPSLNVEQAVSAEEPRRNLDISRNSLLHVSPLPVIHTNNKGFSHSLSSSPDVSDETQQHDVILRPLENSIHSSDLKMLTVQDCNQPAQINRLQFNCGVCGRSFGSKQACETHARSHSSGNRKRFKCSLCPVAFSQVASLKRHTVAIHGIVPEPTYLDNPDDKDFEIGDELDSDSDNSSLETKSHRHVQPRKRHISAARNSSVPCTVTGRPRGRSKRTSEWLLQSLENRFGRPSQVDIVSSSPIETSFQINDPRLDSRYRTILPRPSKGESSQIARPITVSRPRRHKRSRLPVLKSSSGDNRKRVLTPLLCDTLLPKQSVDAADSLYAIQPTTAVYLDHNSLVSNFITIDPHQIQPYTISYATDANHLEEPIGSPTKQPHVLTVAAAYAAQLPASACASTVSNARTAVSSTDPTSEADTVVHSAVSLVSVPSGTVIPSIQIYSPWFQPVSDQLQSTVNLECSESTAVSQAESDHEVTSKGSDTDQSVLPFSCPTSSVDAAQQSIQLYPILGPDGQTTMYYMAAPLDNGEQTSSAFTSGTFYAPYQNQAIVWIPEAASTCTDTFTALANDARRPDQASTTEASGTSFLVTADSMATKTSLTTTFSSDTCTAQHSEYDITGDSSLSLELSETIEVIDLDASKYPSSFTLLEKSVGNHSLTTASDQIQPVSFDPNIDHDICDQTNLTPLRDSDFPRVHPQCELIHNCVEIDLKDTDSANPSSKADSTDEESITRLDRNDDRCDGLLQSKALCASLLPETACEKQQLHPLSPNGSRQSPSCQNETLLQ